MNYSISQENDQGLACANFSSVNYGRNFLSKLSSMREDEHLCDFRICVNEKQFFCHKFVLMAASDYFKAMFTGLFTLMSPPRSESIHFSS